MELFNSPFIVKTQFLSSLSPSKPTLPFSNRLRTNPLRTNRGFHPRYLPKISFSTSTKVYNGGNLQISAQFRHGSKRRNSLRKKINEEQQVRRNFDSLLDPSSKFENHVNELEGFDSNVMNVKDLEESNNGGSDENSIALGDSVLLNKLENWVDQYKSETEFWGIGSGPVFTVFQDIEGNVKRVCVNEDEILQRRGVDLVSYSKQGELGEDFVEVNSKISHAKSLAREIETGEYKLPKNSSIAKFVVEREQSRLVNGFQSFTLRPDMSSNLSRFGFAMLCGLFVLGTMKMIFFGGNNPRKLTREEKERLRRKMKSRAEREMMVRGNVEVIPHVSETLSGSIERPRLDKEELMNTIVKTKASGDRVQFLESSARFTTKSNDFNDKINEIKEMARRARKIERQRASFVDEIGEENEDVKLASNSEDIGKNEEVAGLSFLNKFPKEDSKKSIGSDVAKMPQTVNDPLIVNTGLMLEKSAWDATIDTDIQLPIDKDEEENEEVKLASDSEDIGRNEEVVGLSFLNNFPKEDSKKSMGSDRAKKVPTVNDLLIVTTGLMLNKSAGDATIDTDIRPLIWTPSVVEPENGLNPTKSVSISASHMEFEKEDTESCATPYDESSTSSKTSIENKPSEAQPVKETREYLSKKHDDTRELRQDHKFRTLIEGSDVPEPPADEKLNRETEQILYKEPQVFKETSNTNSLESVCEGSILKKAGSDGDFLESIPNKIDNFEDMDKNKGVDDLQDSKTAANHRDGDHNAEDAPITKETWIEKNFEEFEPIVKKIGVGFKENYMVAKEKVQEELNLNTDVSQLRYDEDEDELEWMKNDSLREIVFQVRENELMGRDPFHMLDAEDKRAFFEGLEKKVEKVNTKLLNLHEWVHSRVENLDYGADGISLYDPVEKIIPRWKGPPVDKDPEFLNNFEEEPKEIFAEGLGTSSAVNEDTKDTLQQSVKSPGRNDTSSAVHNLNTGVSVSPKTVIESSDGSSRAGKKSGKEYWQHTKKWSRGFLDSYNAESDPEVKSVMKDMGKDLDRWITEKEIQETSELMTKIPKKRREHIEKKLRRVKQEVDMFGPQAVVSKYREYAEEKEEDYLWWLDLPYVLCFELYTTEDSAQRVGFYSLEMAVDLELDPKQYHVIAFEDPRDAKHFCHIMQAHMEMLGNGSVFVVARPPKDAFREAKANGFSVTVIRRGDLTLNVDQTLEEVEEQITEIGSKMYHDKIMRERSVDIGSLTKGVFGSSKPTTRRRSKGKLKRPTKN